MLESSSESDILNVYVKYLKILSIEVDENLKETLNSNIINHYNTSLKRAKELYTKISPHIIFADMSVNLQQKAELLRKIKRKDFEVEIVLVGDREQFFDIIKKVDFEINGLLLKPVNKEQLFHLLNNLYKHIYYIYKEKKRKVLAQKIIDAQEDLILVVKKDKVEFANKAFLEFFGVEDVEDFNLLDRSLCEFFIKNKNFFSCSSFHEHNLANELLKLPEEKRVVSMIYTKYFEPRVFMIKVNPLTKDQSILTLTDITKMYLKSREFEKRAFYDELTKIFNRSKFNEMLEYEIERKNRYGYDLSLIIFDIDNFKQINDTYGHLKGDQVLKEVSSIVKNSVRSTDLVARWGGEEFAVLLNSCSLENAVKVAENIRKNIEKFFQLKELPITCSFGVAEFKEYDTKESFIHEADKALYKAKNRGKNRVEAAI